MFLCGRRLKLSIAIERLLASAFLAIKQGREVGWRSGWGTLLLFVRIDAM